MADLETSAAGASYHGQPPDRGRLTPGRTYPGEGYAVLRCGGTEVVLGYTLLHHFRVHLDKDSSCWGQMVDVQKAMHSITCEASLGRDGDGGLSVPVPPEDAVKRAISKLNQEAGRIRLKVQAWRAEGGETEGTAELWADAAEIEEVSAFLEQFVSRPPGDSP